MSPNIKNSEIVEVIKESRPKVVLNQKIENKLLRFT